MATTIWTSRINHWYDVNISEYKFIYDLAKERFEDLKSETESVTDKTIRVGTASVLISGFLLGIIIKESSFHLPAFVIFIFISLVLVNLFFTAKTLLPRSTKNRGLSPTSSTPPNFDDIEDKGHNLKKLYYNAISILQDNIDEVITENSTRANNYKNVIYSFGGVLFALALAIAFLF